MKRYLYIAKEEDFGAMPLAPTNAMYVDPQSAEIDPAGDPVLIYEGMGGLDRVFHAGRYAIEGSTSLAVDDVSIGHFLRGVLGGYQITGTDDGSGTMVAPYTHEFSADRNIIDTYVLGVGKDIFQHQFTGSAFSGLSLELEDGLLTASVDILASKDSKEPLKTNISPSDFAAGGVFAGHNVNISLDASDKSAQVQSFSLSVENGLTPIYGMGSRFTQAYRKGAYLVEAELTLLFEDTSNLEQFWGGTMGPSDSNPTPFSTTINVGPNMDIVLPRGVYTNVSQPVGGRDAITQTATVRGLVNVDGTGPINITLTNDVDSY